MFLPSHTRPFIRANPLEQAVSEEQEDIDGKSIKIRFLLFFYFLVSLFVFLDWPISQGSQGLPQAAPRVEQHSDFRVAPLMLTSQRLSCMVSQQVLFILSVESRKRQKKVSEKLFSQLLTSLRLVMVHLEICSVRRVFSAGGEPSWPTRTDHSLYLININSFICNCCDGSQAEGFLPITM